MSDFLGRIATRAVGEGAVAQPRVRGLFEDAARAAQGLEVVDEEVPVPAERPPTPVAPAAGPDRLAETVPLARAVVPPAAASSMRAPALHAERPHPEAAPEPSPQISPAVQREESQPDAVPARMLAPVVPHEPTPSAPRTSSTLTHATPARVETRPAAAASAVREEAPAVRVHIGRLEVRANVHEAPREEPRPTERQPHGLTLTDYLRGKRESA